EAPRLARRRAAPTTPGHVLPVRAGRRGAPRPRVRTDHRQARVDDLNRRPRFGNGRSRRIRRLSQGGPTKDGPWAIRGGPTRREPSKTSEGHCRIVVVYSAVARGEVLHEPDEGLD